MKNSSIKFLVAFTSLLLITPCAHAAPTNEQLYLMILDLKKEVLESKTREKDLHANLDKANAELGNAKKQLGELPKTELILTAVKQLDEIKKVEEPKIPNTKEGFSISAGALYVMPVTRGISASSIYTNYPAIVPINSYLIDDRKISYGPGFQVSADYQAKNNLDYAIKFKHFESTSNFSFQYSDTYTNLADNLSYTVNYNVLDLEIGKLLTLSENTSLRISGGLRSAIMNEKTIMNSSGWTNPNTYYATSYNYNADSKTNFWGIGPRITADPTWKPFSNNFRVFGSVASSFLMGQQNASYGDDYITMSARKDSFVTMLEAGSGLGYTIKTNSADIDLKTGYQLEHWIVTDQTNNLIFRGYHGAYGVVAIKY